MFGNYKYNQSIVKYNDIFASLFSNIALQRVNKDGTKEQFQIVPIEFAPHTKYIERDEKDPDIERSVSMQMPRLAYDLVNLTYDPRRQLNPVTKRIQYMNGGARVGYAPIPYMYVYKLYVRTKFIEDQYQIAERILPYFVPKFHLTAEILEGSGCPMGVDIVLDNVDMMDDFEGQMDRTRVIVWTYTFSIPGWLMVPNNNEDVSDKVIRWVNVGIGQNGERVSEMSNTYPVLPGTPLEDIEPTDPYTVQTDTWQNYE